jgi:hypothetical protein
MPTIVANDVQQFVTLAGSAPGQVYQALPQPGSFRVVALSLDLEIVTNAAGLAEIQAAFSGMVEVNEIT